jgi:hypothetical protein
MTEANVHSINRSYICVHLTQIINANENDCQSTVLGLESPEVNKNDSHLGANTEHARLQAPFTGTDDFMRDPFLGPTGSM